MPQALRCWSVALQDAAKARGALYLPRLRGRAAFNALSTKSLVGTLEVMVLLDTESAARAAAFERRASEHLLRRQKHLGPKG